MEFRNLDQDTSVFFARELEHIKAKSYDVQYQDLFARQLFPTDNSAGAYARTITYRTYDRVGMAKIISSYAKDLPRADIAGFETTSPVRVIGLSFAYNVDEILASNQTGRSLEQRRANAVQRGTEESFDRIAFFGDTASNLPGFLTNPNIPTGSVVDPGSGTEWVNKTPQQILDDVNALFSSIVTNTLQKERPNTLLLPTNQWNDIVFRPRSESNSDMTVAQFIVKNSPYIASMEDIISIPDLIGAGTAGVDLMVAYDRNPDKLTMEIPLELQFLAPQEVGLEIQVPAWAKTGGVIVYYPLSARFAEGI